MNYSVISCLLLAVALSLVMAVKQTSVSNVVVGSVEYPEVSTYHDSRSSSAKVPPPFLPGELLQLQFEWGSGFSRGDFLVITFMGFGVKAVLEPASSSNRRRTEYEETDVPVDSSFEIEYDGSYDDHVVDFNLPTELVSGKHYLRFEQFSADGRLKAVTSFKQERFYVDNRQLHSAVGRAARINRRVSYGLIYIWDGAKTINIGIVDTTGNIISGTYAFTKDIAQGTWNVSKQAAKGVWQLSKDVFSALYTITGMKAFMRWVDGKDRPLEEQMYYRTQKYMQKTERLPKPPRN